jgi:predicted hotdog family 3-hydroxylacyl-ACP dehydratase
MTPEDLGVLLPHRGKALMLERVVRRDESLIVTRTTTHRAADHPLRHDGRLASVSLIEYGAQAMALHGALLDRDAGREPQSALLVLVRDFVATRDYIDDLDGELEISASVLLASRTSWQYAFEASHDGRLIASGRVTAMARDLPGS